MSHNRTKKKTFRKRETDQALFIKKAYSTSGDKFGEILSSPASHNVEFATEIDSVSEPLKHKLYAKKKKPQTVKNIMDRFDEKTNEFINDDIENIMFDEHSNSSSIISNIVSQKELIIDNIFSKEENILYDALDTPHSEKYEIPINDTRMSEEHIRLDNLENRIGGLEKHIIDIGKEMGNLLEHQMNIIRAISKLSNDISSTKNQIAR